MLTRDQLLSLASTPQKPEPVEVPGGTVYVPRFTAGQLSSFFRQLDGVPDGRAKGVELSLILVDQFATRLFSDADSERLADLPAEIASPASRAFREVNGLAPKG